MRHSARINSSFIFASYQPLRDESSEDGAEIRAVTLSEKLLTRWYPRRSSVYTPRVRTFSFYCRNSPPPMELTPFLKRPLLSSAVSRRGSRVRFLRPRFLRLLTPLNVRGAHRFFNEACRKCPKLFRLIALTAISSVNDERGETGQTHRSFSLPGARLFCESSKLQVVSRALSQPNTGGRRRANCKILLLVMRRMHLGQPRLPDARNVDNATKSGKSEKKRNRLLFNGLRKKEKK